MGGEGRYKVTEVLGFRTRGTVRVVTGAVTLYSTHVSPSTVTTSTRREVPPLLVDVSVQEDRYWVTHFVRRGLYVQPNKYKGRHRRNTLRPTTVYVHGTVRTGDRIDPRQSLDTVRYP